MTKGRFGRDGSISLQRNENYCLTVVVVAIGAAISVRGSVAVVVVVWLAVVASVVPVGFTRFSFSFSLAK